MCPTEEPLDSGQLKNCTGKQTCFPSSLSTFGPLSSNPHASIQQVFPVCSGITMCDFSLTSRAALWHCGVMVSGGWKRFCHSRVEDKAVLQPLCLAECCCDLVSPAWWRITTGTWEIKFTCWTCPLWFWDDLRKWRYKQLLYFNGMTEHQNLIGKNILLYSC